MLSFIIIFLHNYLDEIYMISKSFPLYGYALYIGPEY